MITAWMQQSRLQPRLQSRASRLRGSAVLAVRLCCDVLCIFTGAALHTLVSQSSTPSQRKRGLLMREK
ncbi:hypothetical protein CC86DRAFT_63316 [Ophiobolus disseminans]|uniref:Uncharacterized protein n=1 Tax=Ophiobolus disseminans TaxID=1469910 RepID=A0A6A6ZTA7_9PLEO|nr:hypothetical protein CC86DRAFT_63316 [Ophiobolus disseminans]